jgi:hypothetical protein
MIRWAGRAIAAWAKPRADLIIENLCLRQQLTCAGSRPVGPAAGEADRPSLVAGTATVNRPSIPCDASGARCSVGRRGASRAMWGTTGLHHVYRHAA